MSEKNPHCDSAIESLFREDGFGVFYLNELRSARNAALADAEGFQAVIHSLELMGQQLTGKVLKFGEYKRKLNCIAGLSSLSHKIVSKYPAYHTKFSDLYKELRWARNDAVHQGAYARILTDHAVDITIILEDALMSQLSKVCQFMVRDVIEAKPWHPVSYARQQMLKHSFSHLPVWFKDEKKWKLISEYAVAKYLRRGTPSEKQRLERLAAKIEEAHKGNNENDGLRLLTVEEEDIVFPEKPISSILDRLGAKPILVVDPKREDELVGILTSSDIL